MDLLPARQGGADTCEGVITQARRITEGDDAAVFGQKEIHHRQENLRLARPAHQVLRGKPAHRQESVTLFVGADDPTKRFQRHCFRFVPFHPLPHRIVRQSESFS